MTTGRRLESVEWELAREAQDNACQDFRTLWVYLDLAENAKTNTDKAQWLQFACWAQQDQANHASCARWLLTVKGV